MNKKKSVEKKKKKHASKKLKKGGNSFGLQGPSTCTTIPLGEKGREKRWNGEEKDAAIGYM